MKILKLKIKGNDISIGGLKNYWLSLNMFQKINVATNSLRNHIYEDLDIKFSKLINRL
jgi:hypothetical protein